MDKFWNEYKFSEDPPQIKSHYSTEDVTFDIENQSTGRQPTMTVDNCGNGPGEMAQLTERWPVLLGN